MSGNGTANAANAGVASAFHRVQSEDMVYTSGRARDDRDVAFAERRVSDLRAEFVALAREPGANRRVLCQRFGILAPTGYKWLRRYAAEGAAGL